jgi:hypothetical protein
MPSRKSLVQRASSLPAAILKGIRSPHHAVLFVRMLLFSLMLPLMLRTRLDNLLPRLEPAQSRQANAQEIARVVRYAGYALAGVFPLSTNSCLNRALMLYYFLGREGIALAFRIGVSHDEASFHSHAWLELDGEPYLEAENPRDRLKVNFSYGPRNSEPVLIQTEQVPRP